MPSQNLKLKIIFPLIAVCALFALAGEARATTYYVSPSGNDSNTAVQAQNIATPWASLSKANSAILAGDTVIVRGGVYSPAARPILDITKANTAWRAYQGERPVIDGNETGGSDWTPLVQISASGVVFDGFEIRESRSRGLIVYRASDVTVKNCAVTETWRSGLLLEYSSRVTVDGCDLSRGAKDYELKYWSTTTWPSTLAVVNTKDSTIKNSRIFDSYFEGVDLIKGSENVILEHCEIFGNRRLQVYLSNARNNAVRFNLIYGTGPSHNGAGIWLGGENWAAGSWPSPAWNTGYEVYGNLVANCVQNLRVAGESLTYETNSKIYNNTFVEAVGDGTPWGRNVLYSDNIKSGYGHEFKNNIIIQSANAPAYALAGAVSASNNLWSQAEANIDADLKGAASIYGANPLLTKTSGWNSVVSGGITGNDFKLKIGSPAINKGILLASPYNVDYFGLSRPQGTVFDIGAHEYSAGGGDVQAPAIPSGLSVR